LGADLADTATVLANSSTQVNLIVHFLPLPDHTWVFVVTRAILALM
jgi:hypothetical protein